MTLSLEQARLRAAVLKATAEAARYSEQAHWHAVRGRLSNSDKRCHRAFQALIKARLALKQWGRIR